MCNQNVIQSEIKHLDSVFEMNEKFPTLIQLYSNGSNMYHDKHSKLRKHDWFKHVEMGKTAERC